MFIIIGLVILAAAAVAGVAGFFNNTGSGHAVQGTFELFGYHVTGSTGTLFLFGAVVGAIGMLGLALLLAGARRTSRRGQEARRALKDTQQQTAASSEHHDTLVDQRDSARAQAASAAHERDELERQRDDLTKQREDLIDQRERVYAGSPSTRGGADVEPALPREEPHPNRLQAAVAHISALRPGHSAEARPTHDSHS